jgi:O-methyltransferase involved in polyketide biosynthesis
MVFQDPPPLQSIQEGSTAIHTTNSTTMNNRIFVDPADRPIIATAEDAILAKQATVQAGYYQDPFLEPFCQRAVGVSASASSTATSSHNRQQQQRRQVQPIIKRGTHARVCVMDRAIGAFLNLHFSSSSSCQIVVLGAGKDTSFFRYRAGLLNYNNETPVPTNYSQAKVHWYEVDQPSVIQEKAKTIQETPLLSSSSSSFSSSLQPTPHGFQLVDDNDDLSTSSSLTYKLVSHDLRDPPNQLFQKLALDTKLPTLYLLECVLMYLPNDASHTLLQALNGSGDHVWVACYEPILQNDPFGIMMQQNLIKARVAQPDSGLLQTRTLSDQLTKLISSTNNSFTTATGCDMWSAYETIVTNDQRQRANQCEFLDEVEEWILIMRHYAFVVACGGTSSTSILDAASKSSDDEYTRIGPGSPLGFVSGKCQRLQKI